MYTTLFKPNFAVLLKPLTTILTTTELIRDTHNHSLFNFFTFLVCLNALNTLFLSQFIDIYIPTNQKVRGSNPLQRAIKTDTAFAVSVLIMY